MEYASPRLDLRQYGNLTRHSWGIVEAQLGHKIENSRAQFGHGRGPLSYLGLSWGTVEAKPVEPQLGHS